MIEKRWKHDELADDLAISKGGIPFLNVCLGSPWLNGRKQKTPRADLVVCRPSYRRFCLSIYEVKVSRSDFLSDIRSGKWKEYLKHCNRFYFAVSSGVLQKKDLPDDAGLITRGPNGWSTSKAAPELNTEIPIDTLKSIIFARQRRSAREKRLDDIVNMGSPFSRKDYMGRLKAARVLGNEFGILHEEAMRIGGVGKAIDLLKSSNH